MLLVIGIALVFVGGVLIGHFLGDGKSLRDERYSKIVGEFGRTPARPYSDADQLVAVAEWLDRIDDAAGTPENGRTINNDLRRIATNIRKGI